MALAPAIAKAAPNMNRDAAVTIVVPRVKAVALQVVWEDVKEVVMGSVKVLVLLAVPADAKMAVKIGVVILVLELVKRK